MYGSFFQIFLSVLFFGKVGPMVFDGGESESTIHFLKFVNSRITLWDVNSVNNVSLSTRTTPSLLQNRVTRGSWS
jgi:hypothetical protein